MIHSQQMLLILKYFKFLINDTQQQGLETWILFISAFFPFLLTVDDRTNHLHTACWIIWCLEDWRLTSETVSL